MRVEKCFAITRGLSEVLCQLTVKQNVLGILLVVINVAIEGYIIYGISHKLFSASIVALLLISRLATAFVLSTFISIISCNQCTSIRNVTLQKEWLRSKPNSGDLSSRLLMLYDHLVQFYFVARLRIIYDILYLSIIISFFIVAYDVVILIYVALVSLFGVFVLQFLHKLASNVSRKMALLESELVSVGMLINERGFAGWSNPNLSALLSLFNDLSGKINRYYIIRLTSSNTIRMFLEVGVFGVVAAGMLDFSQTGYSGNFEISSAALLLLISRLAPVFFGILTLASTLGYGQMAKDVYVRKNELG